MFWIWSNVFRFIHTRAKVYTLVEETERNLFTLKSRCGRVVYTADLREVSGDTRWTHIRTRSGTALPGEQSWLLYGRPTVGKTNSRPYSYPNFHLDTWTQTNFPTDFTSVMLSGYIRARFKTFKLQEANCLT